jgi:hypothetical protein
MIFQLICWLPLLDVQAHGQAVGNRLGPEAEVPQSHVALFVALAVVALHFS